MQRVTNCILIQDETILLIKKPRRGWYAIPGGKMEQGETIKESAVREFQEETGLQLIDPVLGGAFTFTVYRNDDLAKEWMMFTFVCTQSEGKLTSFCKEGELEWVSVDAIHDLPMAEGDRKIFDHVLSMDEMLFGSFAYTEDYELLHLRLDPTNS
ncbi:8-oxo-dGTP diphosphatase [Lentibacillus lipolyticus]|nr:8-oxo-dGTP diphosphatase [Lentibacillus lipolyticus]